MMKKQIIKSNPEGQVQKATRSEDEKFRYRIPTREEFAQRPTSKKTEGHENHHYPHTEKPW